MHVSELDSYSMLFLQKVIVKIKSVGGCPVKQKYRGEIGR